MSDNTSRLQSLETEQYRQAAIIAAWQKDVSWLQMEVANHSKALTDGNNGHSVTTRLAIVEQKLDGLRLMLEEGRRGRWDVTKAAVAALLALATGVATALLVK